MTPAETAIALICDLVHAENDLAREANTKRGMTKKSEKREARAIRNLFFEIAGEYPTQDQIDKITSY